MIFHLSSSVKSSCHTGIAESQGVASFGNPLPPVLTRQKVYPSTIVSIVPLSVKFIGLDALMGKLFVKQSNGGRGAIANKPTGDENLTKIYH